MAQTRNEKEKAGRREVENFIAELISEDTVEEVENEMIEHVMVFLEALAVYEDRSVKYGQAWRRRGWLGNLMNLFNCVDRLDGFFWRKEPASDYALDSLDDAFDAINYLIFFIRNVRAGNRSGI